MSISTLDDLLSPEQLSSLATKRAKKARVDLTEFIPAKPKLTIELLPAVRVLFYIQRNHCLNCKSVVDLPLGLVAMHPLKRNGRITTDLVGVKLCECNDYPELERTLDILHSNSLCCVGCVAESRFIPRVQGSPIARPLIPGTPEWQEQSGYGNSAEIRARAEELHRRAESFERELERREEKTIIPPSLAFLSSSLADEEKDELTNPQDTE
jgi:hypothetical protein